MFSCECLNLSSELLCFNSIRQKKIKKIKYFGVNEQNWLAPKMQRGGKETEGFLWICIDID